MPIHVRNPIAQVIRLIMAAVAIAALVKFSWFNMILADLALLLSFLPDWIENRYRIEFPLDFELGIIFFIFASLLLGEGGNFYGYFWWWDILLHVMSAIAFALIGFVLLLFLFQTNKIISRPFWIALFSFCFALAVGALWEIFEFTMDQTLGTNMQKSGLTDTMWDLICDASGALFAAIAGYDYVRGGRTSYLSSLIDRFLTKNPRLTE